MGSVKHNGETKMFEQALIEEVVLIRKDIERMAHSQSVIVDQMGMTPKWLWDALHAINGIDKSIMMVARAVGDDQ